MSADPPWIDEMANSFAIVFADRERVTAVEVLKEAMRFAANRPRDYEVTPEMLSAAKHGQLDASFSATSWNGFNLSGDEKSIKELHRLMSQDSRATALERELGQERERQLRSITEAMVEAVTAVLQSENLDFGRTIMTVTAIKIARAVLESAAKAKG